MKFVNLFLCSMKKGEKESRQRDGAAIRWQRMEESRVATVFDELTSESIQVKNHGGSHVSVHLLSFQAETSECRLPEIAI